MRRDYEKLDSGGLNTDIPYRVEYRKVKYPRLEFRGLELVVILSMEVKDPLEIIEKRKTWIQKKWNIIQEAVKQAGNFKDFMIFGEAYTIENTVIEKPRIDHEAKKIYLNKENPAHQQLILKQLRAVLKAKVKQIVEEYVLKYSLKPNKIVIKRLQTKWGSCSGRKNITLNLKLVCLPEEIIKYIVFHELLHLKYKRHNKAFWQALSREFPNHKELEKELLTYWFATELLFQNFSK